MTEELVERALALELEAQRKASVSISKIEASLEEWKAMERKPAHLGKRIQRLERAYLLIRRWEMESLRGRRDFESTLKRLRKFTELCKRIQEMGKWEGKY